MPRKTDSLKDVARDLLEASMRPRPDAAENAKIKAMRAAGEKLASMRPRPDAAENGGVL